VLSGDTILRNFPDAEMSSQGRAFGILAVGAQVDDMLCVGTKKYFTTTDTLPGMLLTPAVVKRGKVKYETQIQSVLSGFSRLFASSVLFYYKNSVFNATFLSDGVNLRTMVNRCVRQTKKGTTKQWSKYIPSFIQDMKIFSEEACREVRMYLIKKKA